MLPIALYLLQKEGTYLEGHELFLKKIGNVWQGFVEEMEKLCRTKCLEDLQSTTRYVSWSLHNKSRTDLSDLLQTVSRNRNSNSSNSASSPNSNSDSVPVTLVNLLETTLWSRRLGVATEDIVSALVGKIFDGIRDHFITTVELKFNSFFLMPVIDEFPMRLREDLEAAYQDDVDGVFDVGNIRSNLESRQRNLDAELVSVEQLQAKFAGIHATLVQPQQPKHETPYSNPKSTTDIKLGSDVVSLKGNKMRNVGGKQIGADSASRTALRELV